MTKRYYRLTKILTYKSQYNILLGMRSNGKSYAVKEFVLKNAYEGKDKFIYMRRYQTDVKMSDVTSYFSDMPIAKITGGKYEGITVYRSYIYFCNYDENEKPIKGQEIGRAVYLSGIEHFKSQAFPDVTDVIYEEFVTKGLYLEDEPNKLQNFVSTIARDKNIRVWMVANTISRVCPYFSDWCLSNIPKQAQGTIDTYEYTRTNVDGKEYITRIAVENCANAGTSSSMFFGTVAESITGGQWEVKECPKLPRDENDNLKPYIKIYELLLINMGFQFILELCVDPETGGQWVYVKPHTTKRRITRIITDEFSTNPYVTNCTNNRIPAEVTIHNLLTMDKVCFSDNLTGSDFEAVTQNMKGRL